MKRNIRISLAGTIALLMLALAAMAQRPSPVYAACTTTGDYPTDVLADNPVLYFRLDETAGTTADNLGSLGAAVDGTYANVTLDTTSLVANDINGSVTFNGTTSRLDVPDSNSINTGTFVERTIEFIFAADTTAGRQMLFEEGGGTRGLSIYIDNGNLFMNGWNDANDDGGTSSPWAGAGNLFISTPVSAGTVYHVVMVMDGDATGFTGTITGYLNGTSFGSVGGVGRLFSHASDITIGENSDTRFHDGGGGTTNDLTSVPFDGIIDELAIYNTALTQGQIDQHVLNCAPPLAVSLSGFAAAPTVMMPLILAVFALLSIATVVAVRHNRS